MSRNPIDVPLDCEIELRLGDFKQRDFDLLVERVGDNDKSAGFFAYGNAIECYDRLCRERLQVDECGFPVLVSFLFHPITSWSDVALKEMENCEFSGRNFLQCAKYLKCGHFSCPSRFSGRFLTCGDFYSV